MPRVRFTMIGGPMPAYRTYYDDVLEAAARLKNVRMAGPVRYADVGGYFDRARIFLNTSSVEGFPNTYLQSWVRGVPVVSFTVRGDRFSHVVSFFDPDGLVQKQQLGWPANSLDDMREAIENILADDERREAMSRRAREFARSEFSPPAVAGRYLDLLNAREQPRLRFGTTG